MLLTAQWVRKAIVDFPLSVGEMTKRLASLQSVIFLPKKTQFSQANKLAHYKTKGSAWVR